MLHFCAPGLFADRGEHGVALFSICAGGANLDEFVGEQIALDFGDDGGGQTRIADENDRFKCVRTGAKFAALRGGNIEHVDDSR